MLTRQVVSPRRAVVSVAAMLMAVAALGYFMGAL